MRSERTGLVAFVTSLVKTSHDQFLKKFNFYGDQWLVSHDQWLFFITRDQLNMTSDQFEKVNDQNWSQNQLIMAGHDQTGHESHKTRKNDFWFKFVKALYFSTTLNGFSKFRPFSQKNSFLETHFFIKPNFRYFSTNIFKYKWNVFESERLRIIYKILFWA